MKVRVSQRPGGRVTYSLWCPACDDLVCIDNSWGFNGDTEQPTFTPSLLTQVEFTDGRRHVCHSFVTDGVWNYLSDSTHAMAGQERICHSFVTDGVWDYLADCTHDKAGRTMPVVDLPEWVLAG